MKSRLFSLKSLALFCVATLLFTTNCFSQNSKVTTEDLKDKELNAKVTIESSNLAPNEQNPTQTPVQVSKIEVTKQPFSKQEELEIKDANTPYYTVSEMPVYSAGKSELPLYVLQEARYPVDAMKDKAEGVVVVQVIVEKDGSITNPKVITPIHPKLDNEALRVVGTLKNFTPGKQNGEVVRCYYEIPVPFLLNKK
jgi:TonB family protein